MTTTTPTSGQARINWKRLQRAAYWAAGQHTVWPRDPADWGTPRHTDWGSPYQSRVIAWLRANRIDSTRVDADSPIVATRSTIAFTEIRLNEQGRPFMDGRDRLAVEQRTVRLRVHFVATEA